MTMHLVCGMTTTSTKKRKPKKKTQSLLQAEAAHEKFLKKMGVHPSQSSRSLTVKHPPYTRLNVSRLESDLGSNPSGSTNSRGLAQSGSASALGAEGRKFESSIPDQCFYDPSMAKKEPMQYTGTEIIGIAQMHKSNAVPIRGKKDAIEVARMRRG
jgi:hypothetical protein